MIPTEGEREIIWESELLSISLQYKLFLLVWTVVTRELLASNKC